MTLYYRNILWTYQSCHKVFRLHFWSHFFGIISILHLLLPTSIWFKQVHYGVTNFSSGSNLVSFPFDIPSSSSASFPLTLTYYYHILDVWGLVFGDDLDPHPTFTIRVATMPVILPLSHQGPSGCVGFGLTTPLPCLFYSSPVIPIWFLCDWYLCFYSLLDSAPPFLPLGIPPLLSAYWSNSIVPAISLTTPSSYHCYECMCFPDLLDVLNMKLSSLCSSLLYL